MVSCPATLTLPPCAVIEPMMLIVPSERSAVLLALPMVSPPRLVRRLSPEVLKEPEKLLPVGLMTNSPAPP